MKKPEKELGYYMGWFIAYLLAAGFTIYFTWLGKPVSWCSGAADEHCFREWMSALGGWAAIPAAVVTVYYLAKQTSEARVASSRERLVSLAPDLQRALLVRALCHARLGLIDVVESEIETMGRLDIQVRVESLIEDIKETLTRDEIKIAVSIFLMPNTSRTPIEFLEMFKEFMNSMSHLTEDDYKDEVIKMFPIYIESTRDFFRKLEEKAKDAHARYQQLIDPQ
ncbi:MAG: hypothetical protein DI589_06680 [Shinella sp.]|nr:MAG: hypothetical protein DI589_06680 [Shinella sp.]